MGNNRESGVSPAALAALAKGNISDAMTASIPGGIEASEKLGQQELVQSTNLPIEGLQWHSEQLERWGITFKREEIDGLFYSARLPDGWKKVATDHSMWSELRDEKGRRRAGIFYKAASYDRSAHIQWSRRYAVRPQLPDGRGRYDVKPEELKEILAVVLDAGQEIYRTEVVPVVNDDRGRRAYEASRAVEMLAEEYLDATYPDWKSPFAYWD